MNVLPLEEEEEGGGAGAERNTPIKEVSMGIYARVNSPATTTGGEGGVSTEDTILRYSPLLSFNRGQ